MNTQEAIEILEQHNCFRLGLADRDRHAVEVGVAIDHAIEVMKRGLWQPIETAPKDGTDIIVNMPQVESGCTFIYWKDGWRLTYDGKFLGPHVIKPTHWMPLPDAPEEMK